MRFEENKMYRNIYNSKDSAFHVDNIVKQDKNGCDMEVTWYKLTDDGRYITIGVSGEYFVPKQNTYHYLEV